MTRFHSQFGEIILLADGVGGHSGGDKAAEIAIKDFATHLGHLDPLTPVDDALRSAIQSTNRRIHDLGHSGDPATRGMGTTIAVAALRFSPEGTHLYAANAGDSRIYLWRDGGLKRLSRDHTVAAELIEAGLVRAEDADQHPGSRVLTKALGQAPDISPESRGPISLQDGDGVLLCTDGLSSYLTDDQIVNGLRQDGDFREMVHTLADAALNCGSRDNISIQFLRISEVVSGLQKGARVDHYVLEDFLGAGGMAQVWLGRHSTLHKKLVAIKILQPGLGLDGTELLSRFKREGQEQFGLQHDNIIRVENYGETCVGSERIAYLILQYIEGESLADRIRRPEPISSEEFLQIAFPVLDALGYAHAQGLIHRDVKSSNILLDKTGKPYLGDFGLVRLEGDHGATKTTAILGTTHYMSPEHILTPKSVDRRSDIYSLGCVFYEMLTGAPPFGHQIEDLTIKIAHVKTQPRRSGPLTKMSVRPWRQSFCEPSKKIGRTAGKLARSFV